MKQTQHTETKQVQTLRSQERFIKYSVRQENCHYCDEVLYQTYLEYIDFEGNIITKQVFDHESNREWTLVKMNHENDKHHDIFVKDIKAYKVEVSARVKARKEAN